MIGEPVTVTQILVIAGAFIIAGIAKGAIGLGLPPIALALMSYAVPLQDALALMVVPTLGTNVWQAIRGRDFPKLMRRFWTMAVAAAAALIFVAMAFGHLGSPQATAWVGVVLAVYAALALTAWRPSVTRATERWASPLVGLASGAVAGVTGLSGLPLLPYMQSLDIDRDDLVEALGILFLSTVGALTLALALQGSFHPANLAGAVAAMAPTFAGMWIGQKARRAVSPETFRRFFLVGMLVVGLHLARTLL